jgi:precorrin-2 dehydrogenase/sirohydrochlorin ferrochelatase
VLPIVLDPSRLRVGLAGAGEAFDRRRAHLLEAGIAPVFVRESDSLAGLQILYVAGAERAPSEALASRARAVGVLVNVEDQPDLCDFNVPATVRRGDLLLTASSAGRAPGLVRLLREWLSRQFGPDWGGRVDEVARERAALRALGLPPVEISRRTRALAEGWLP